MEDDDATETSYWCHMCSRSVTPLIEGDLIKCTLCLTGFVEEIENNPPDSVTPDQAADSLWAPILFGMLNDHDHTRNHEDEDVTDDEQNENDAETDLDRQLEDIMRRRRRHSAAILALLQGIRAGLFESESNEEDNPDSELAVLINSFNQRIRSEDSDLRSGSGSLGDYFIGSGFEMLLQRLAENDRYGTPPATKEAVEALSVVKVEEGLLQCSVCLDDFEIGKEAKEMPCKHKFHGDCLLPWLELHSSCPVCRYLLPTTDDEQKTDAGTSRNDGDDDDISIASMENNGSTSVESSSNT